MGEILNIVSSGMDGEGIAKDNGRVIFVDGAIMGEKVEAQIIKENKNFARAKLVNVIEKSQHRCLPKCEYYGRCGGCNMQHIDFKKALEIKKQNVQNLFDKSKLNFKIESTEQSDKQYYYRNKLTMYLTKNNCLGFYKKNSKELIDIKKCELVSEEFNKLINILNNFLKNNKEFNSFILKGISIRQINNYFIINLIIHKKINLNKLQQYLALNKIQASVYYCINAKNNLPTYPCTFAFGEKQVMAKEYDIFYPVYPMSFLQVNGFIKNKIYTDICGFIDKNANVLDSYSGAGLLSAIMAKNAKSVMAVEVDKMASRACEILAKNNKIKNLKSICGDVKNVVPNILKENNIDIIVLDPARRGVDTTTLDAVKNAGAKKIIYLSCNPATLARDIKEIINVGYKISFAKVYDMFPQTSEVETLVVLNRIG